ncbi:endonuclease dU [[Eubacterium] cellulosolvens]
MKDQIRVIGIDDGPFKFSQPKVIVIGVVMRPPQYIEGICRTRVSVDGTDANAVLTKMINKSNYKDQLRLIMLDGVALGGFNVVDIEKLYQSIEIPVTTISRTKPRLELIKRTLKTHFSDWKARWESINNLEMVQVNTNYSPIYIKFIGISKTEVQRFIRLTTVRGVLPEPIRVAHLIATAMIKGESAGGA